VGIYCSGQTQSHDEITILGGKRQIKVYLSSSAVEEEIGPDSLQCGMPYLLHTGKFQSVDRPAASYSGFPQHTRKHLGRVSCFLAQTNNLKLIAYNKHITSHLFFIVPTHALHYTLTLRRLMSYIYGAPILDVSRSHTTTQHSR